MNQLELHKKIDRLLANNSVEVKQEEAILKRIKEARRDKITIIISHRLSALGIADRVLTLDNGNILSA